MRTNHSPTIPLSHGIELNLALGSTSARSVSLSSFPVIMASVWRFRERYHVRHPLAVL